MNSVSFIDGHIDGCDTCVICGRDIPEGRQVCVICGYTAEKKKADLVEVVRCEECKYQEDCARQIVHTTRDYVLEQNISTYNKVDFCSYGERKGKE